jgi:hypothetical protein
MQTALVVAITLAFTIGAQAQTQIPRQSKRSTGASCFSIRTLRLIRESGSNFEMIHDF